MSSTVTPSSVSLRTMPHSSLRLRRVEPGGGLVEEEDARAPDQRRREVEPAAHAPGVGACGAPGRVAEPELPEELGGPGLRRGAPLAEQPGDEHEVLGAGERLVDPRVLPGEPDERAHAVRLGEHVVPADDGAPLVRRQQRGEHPRRGGLAGAVGPQHPQHGALGGGEARTRERGGGAEALDETVGLDGRWHSTTVSEGSDSRRGDFGPGTPVGPVPPPAVGPG